eukprot:g3479.t1
MKYLNVPALAWISTYLQDCTVGTELWDGQVEAYSCKAAGDDKKLQKKLLKQYSQDAETRVAIRTKIYGEGSKAPDVITPLGPRDSAETHKLLVHLISCLNATYGVDGYDFSNLTSKNFEKLAYDVRTTDIDSRLRKIETVNGDREFRKKLWKAIDDVILLKDCSVYRYLSDLEGDPLSFKGDVPTLWSMNYFFYNKKLNRIVYFTCTAVHRASVESAMMRPRSPSPMMTCRPWDMSSEPVAEQDEFEFSQNSNATSGGGGNFSAWEDAEKKVPEKTVDDGSCIDSKTTATEGSRDSDSSGRGDQGAVKPNTTAADPVGGDGESSAVASERNNKRATTSSVNDEEDDGVSRWDHEVATCDRTFGGIWDGKWEPCQLISKRDGQCNVICQEDNKHVGIQLAVPIRSVLVKRPGSFLQILARDLAPQRDLPVLAHRASLSRSKFFTNGTFPSKIMEWYIDTARWDDIYEEMIRERLGEEGAEGEEEEGDDEDGRKTGLSNYWPSSENDASRFMETVSSHLQRKQSECKAAAVSAESEEDEDDACIISLDAPRDVRPCTFGPLNQKCWETKILWGQGDFDRSFDEATGDEDDEGIDDGGVLNTSSSRLRTLSSGTYSSGSPVQSPAKTPSKTSPHSRRRDATKSKHWGVPQIVAESSPYNAGTSMRRRNSFEDVVEDTSSSSSSIPKTILANRQFASFQWLKGVLWDRRHPVQDDVVFRKLRALILDENDPNLDLQVHNMERMTLSSQKRNNLVRTTTQNVMESETDEEKTHEAEAQQKPQRIVARFKLGENAWIAENLVDEAYQSELGPRALKNFHRPRIRFDRDERNRPVYMTRARSVRIEGPVATAGSHLADGRASARFTASVRRFSDLSASTGEVVLFEHAEQFPSCLSNVGMICRIVNIHAPIATEDEIGNFDEMIKRTNAARERFNQQHRHALGNDADVHGSFRILREKELLPIMGGIVAQPETTTSLIVNRLYRAPTVRHRTRSTDFLVIRLPAGSSGKARYVVRKIPATFAIGQHTPNKVVFTPNRDVFKSFQSNYVMFWLSKMFRRARTHEKGKNGVEFRRVRDLFSSVSTTLLRSKLRKIAKFEKRGKDNKLWIRRSDKEADTIAANEELRKSIRPYMVCLYEGMQAGIFRLRRKGIFDQQKIDQGGRNVGAFVERLKQRLESSLEESRSGTPANGVAFGGDAASDTGLERSRFDIANFIYRQLITTPWVLTKTYFECHNSDLRGKQFLELSEIVRRPCKSIDPLGGQMDGYAFLPHGSRKIRSKGRRSRSLTTNEKEESGDANSAANDPKKWSLKRLKVELRRLGYQDSNIDAMPPWRQRRACKIMMQGRGQVKMHRAKYRKQVDSIFRAQMRMLERVEVGEDSSDDDDDSDLDDALLESLEQHIDDANGGETRPRMTDEARKLETMKNMLTRTLPARSVFGDRTRDTVAGGDSRLAIARTARRAASAALSVNTSRGGSAASSKAVTPCVSRPASPSSFPVNERGIPKGRKGRLMVLLKTETSFLEDGTKRVRRTYYKKDSMVLKYIRDRKKSKRLQSLEAGGAGGGSKKRASSKRKTSLESQQEIQMKARLEELRQKNLTLQKFRELNRSGGASKKKKGQRCCTACGMPGHSRNSKICPLYCDSSNKGQPITLNLSKEKLDSIRKSKVKIKINTRKIDDEKAKSRQKRRARQLEDARLYERPSKKRSSYSRSRRNNPKMLLHSMIDGVVDRLWTMREAHWFKDKVRNDILNARGERYGDAIKTQMNLGMIRKKIKRRQYMSRQGYLKDMKAIVDNAVRFNGMTSEVTKEAYAVYNAAKAECEKQENEFRPVEFAVDEEQRQMDIVAGRSIQSRRGGGKQIIAPASTTAPAVPPQVEISSSSDDDDGVEEVIAAGSRGE